jgi:alpha-glucosidase
MKSKSIGDVNNVVIDNQELTFKTDDFSGSIHFFAEDIVRVRLRPHHNEARAHSYAVSMEPQSVSVKIEKAENEVKMSTSKCELRFTKSPFRISFYSASGELLSQDDPAFGTSYLGTEVCTYRSLQEGERFLGMGEKVGPLDKRGHSFVNWNTDKFGYSVDEDPLYLSIPFFVGLHQKGMYGLFLNNSHRSQFNFGASSHRYSWFSAQAGEMDYFLFSGETIPSLIEAYTRLTGRMELPPKWSLGYQQCRYSYYPDHEIKSLARNFRDRKIPADVLYLDIHYMQDYKAFTFDQERFPDPEGLHNDLREQGFRTVAIVDPGIKVEKGYGTYDRGVQKKLFITMPDGEAYQGQVWPGWSHFPDFTDPKTRSWWGEELKFYTDKGVSGIWNDMNEPAAWGQSLPAHLEFEYEGERTSHLEARNIYGMQMARASKEGLQSHLNGERPFILTRAGFAGIQRHSAVWTGDNVSTDEHMLLACRMQVGMGISGISFSANDIGGFAQEASPALFARWMSIGAFQPMFRAHTQVNFKDAEPWSFGEEVEQISRNYIALRYRLLPYIYSMIWRSTQDGMPLMRSLAMEEPLKDEVYDQRFQDQFLCGDSLLIIPCSSTVELIEAYFPAGCWYDLYTDEVYEGGKTHFLRCPIYRLPVFVRAGSILPMQSQTQSTAEKNDEVLNLHVYPTANGRMDLYEDDGISFDHVKGSFCLRKMSLKNGTLVITTDENGSKSEFKKLKILIHGIEEKKEILYNGKNIALKSEEHRFITPISGIDTFYEDKGIELRSIVKTFETQLISDEMIFSELKKAEE